MADKIKGGRGGSRPGSGRKPKPPAEKQSKRVMVTFTPAEHAELRKAAAAEPIGTYLRRLVLRVLARRRK